MNGRDLNNRKRRVIFSKADDGNIYAISVTNSFIDQITEIRKAIQEDAKFFSEAVVLDIVHNHTVCVKLVKNEYKDLFKNTSLRDDINYKVYTDIPSVLCNNKSLTNDYRIKLVLWKDKTRALTTGFDVPMEIHLYKLGTYSIIRIPVEDSVYTNLVSKENIEIFYDTSI